VSKHEMKPLPAKLLARTYFCEVFIRERSMTNLKRLERGKRRRTF